MLNITQVGKLRTLFKWTTERRNNVKVTHNTSLIKNLDFILKSYYPYGFDRRKVLTEIVTRFEQAGSLRYSLDSQTSLILLKDDRRLNHLRRFQDSPFPLVSNVEYFCNSVGGWNEELLSYGIKTRSKSATSPLSAVGSRIHLVKLDNINSRGNRYLKRQYKRLQTYRKTSNIFLTPVHKAFVSTPPDNGL